MQDGFEWGQYRAIIEAQCEGIPPCLAAVPVNDGTSGGRWASFANARPACNDERAHGRAEGFAREAVRSQALHFGLRLSQVMHDDDWSH